MKPSRLGGIIIWAISSLTILFTIILYFPKYVFLLPFIGAILGISGGRTFRSRTDKTKPTPS